MDRRTITIDPFATKLRRVGRVARRRMRIDGDAFRNGIHTDGTLTVVISGLGAPVAGVPDSFEWRADRPVALVIIRSGIDGEDVGYQVGPSRSGSGRSANLGDGTGIRYVAFCYDATPEPVAGLNPVSLPAPLAIPAVAASAGAVPGFGPTPRERRSILGLLLQGGGRRTAGGSLA
jgi:hypothetical protein